MLLHARCELSVFDFVIAVANMMKICPSDANARNSSLPLAYQMVNRSERAIYMFDQRGPFRFQMQGRLEKRYQIAYSSRCKSSERASKRARRGGDGGSQAF